MKAAIQLELDWLRYFYSQAKHGMGPASSDIYEMIKEQYIADGDVVPKSYLEDEA